MKVTAVAETADEATRLACEKAMEYVQSVHGDVGYDDPMLVRKYFGVDVLRSKLAAPLSSRAAPPCWRRKQSSTSCPTT